MTRTLVSSTLLLLLLTSAVAAQDGRGRGGWDPSERIRALDTNGDGRLEASEMPEQFRSFFQRRLRDAGLDPDKPVELDKYLELMRSGRSWGRDDDNDNDRRRSRGRDDDDRSNRRGDDNDDAVNLVPGFGEEFELSPVPGFGIEADAAAGNAIGRGVPLEDRYHEKVIGYVDGILRRYDRDGNQVLDQGEWSRSRWRNPPPEDSDRNGDGRLSREELCERVQNYDEYRSLRVSSSSGSSRSSASANDNRVNYKRYADGLLDRYDENKNGVLEEREWRRMSPYLQGADANGDKRITADELIDRVANYSWGNGYGSRTADRNSSPEEGESYRVSGGQSGYKVRSAKDHLPKGLPAWFTENDGDGDGQIAMAEFASSWTAAKIEEFQSYDADGDGIITPEECLSAKPARSESPRYRRR